MELADEDLKTAIVHIIKNVKENINIMERNIYLSQIKLLRMSKKKKIHWMALIADWKLQKISEPKDIAVVTVQNEMGRGLQLGEGGWRTKPHDLWVYSKEFHLCEIRAQERRKKKTIWLNNEHIVYVQVFVDRFK